MNQQPHTQNQSQAPDAASQGEWDEARLEEAMQRLKLLHIKVRLLRDTIPQMIQPLLQKQPSPDAMFAAYMKSITEAQNNVKEFTELMRDDFSQQITTQVQKRQAEEPNGIVPWRHQDHPDWFTLDKK
ncbi:hypothetical protein BHE90_010371 [Fusarium euwallaceae]|uniref:Uncharacterized protein n=4 Tax=Fusarium solani species complex TaxID=232080 RepID=A0A428T1L8_9HYPO|nr:hypothetical protein CEP51_006718 [Fusarium floridanum]RSL95941.1 hypothetical protein CEP52_011787 [Fusarium oligoseptatum]RSM20537.1 hypothetical protein CDV31_000514 [Fusarium ambrosium]RTE75172.1 hypothetical protein BHE90_010371 [Fusarium euwallaceae]